MEDRGSAFARGIAGLADRVNADASLTRRGRFLSLSWQLANSADSYLIRIEEGRIAAILPGPLVMPSCRFGIGADAASWEAFCAAMPAPGCNDIFALLRRKRLSLTGDMQPLMANLLYIKGVLALLRAEPAAIASPEGGALG